MALETETFYLTGFVLSPRRFPSRVGNGIATLFRRYVSARLGTMWPLPQPIRPCVTLRKWQGYPCGKAGLENRKFLGERKQEYLGWFLYVADEKAAYRCC